MQEDSRPCLTYSKLLRWVGCKSQNLLENDGCDAQLKILTGALAAGYSTSCSWDLQQECLRKPGPLEPLSGGNGSLPTHSL